MKKIKEVMGIPIYEDKGNLFYFSGMGLSIKYNDGDEKNWKF